MTRTIEEVEAQLLPVADIGYDEYDCDEQHDAGMRSGFRGALRMLRAGASSDEIYAYARKDEREYRSIGDDYADAYQSGYTNALMWASEQFDWDENGRAVFREDNKLGIAPGQSRH